MLAWSIVGFLSGLIVGSIAGILIGLYVHAKSVLILKDE